MSRHDRFFNLLSDIGYYLGIVPDATLREINRIVEIYRKVDLYSGNFDYLDRYYTPLEFETDTSTRVVFETIKVSSTISSLVLAVRDCRPCKGSTVSNIPLFFLYKLINR